MKTGLHACDPPKIRMKTGLHAYNPPKPRTKIRLQTPAPPTRKTFQTCPGWPNSSVNTSPLTSLQDKPKDAPWKYPWSSSRPGLVNDCDRPLPIDGRSHFGSQLGPGSSHGFGDRVRPTPTRSHSVPSSGSNPPRASSALEAALGFVPARLQPACPLISRAGSALLRNSVTYPVTSVTFASQLGPAT